MTPSSPVRPRRSLAVAVAVAVSLVLGAGRPVRAQQIALSHFDPAFAGDRLFGVPSPYAPGPLTFHGMVLGEYARYPLLARRVSDGEPVAAVVRGQLFLHLNGTFSFKNRLAVNLDVPVALFQSGDVAESPKGADFGDVRLGVRGSLYGEPGGPFQFGVGAYGWLPTGTGRFVTDGTVRALPYVVVGGRRDPVVWSAAAGAEFRPPQQIDGVALGSQFYAAGGFGIGLGPRRLGQIGLETTTFVSFERPSGDNLNAELLLHGKYRFLDFLEAGVFIGPGLSTGIGTPAVRAGFLLAYTPQFQDELRDGDGDGVLNQSDACPKVPGLPNEDPSQDGCPPAPPGKDTDGDGVEDTRDACPDVPGVPQGDESQNGCPIDEEDEAALLGKLKKTRPGSKGDADGDGIADDVDACPEEKGKADKDPSKNGCPSLVRVTEEEIVLLNEVYFDTDKAVLHSMGRNLLDQVAEVLLQHPEFKRVEVQGHTDSRGTLAHNEWLGKARALAVRAALTQRSIDPGRLEARGYGPLSPADTNLTVVGRQRNRRVQFKILEKTAAPAPKAPPASTPVPPASTPVSSAPVPPASTPVPSAPVPPASAAPVAPPPVTPPSASSGPAPAPPKPGDK